MADLKITQLTELAAVDVAASDVLPIVDVSPTATTKKVTVASLQTAANNAGTANGIVYLNASKVPTTGTALSYDGSDLVLNFSGNSYIGTNQYPNAGSGGIGLINAGSARKIFISSTSTTATANLFQFDNPNGVVGSISTDASSTIYATSSDYRLKQDVQPMQNALSVIAQLKPVTYKWKADGSEGQGFIAHELQAVVPQCVAGQKDAIDENGKPVYQGVDTSFLVPMLVKAIQELKAEIELLKG